ncbi:MAG: protein jag [Lachnospiraceae bacterium]|nr:protein jag [Lachnospiraceae bacterium]
MEGWKEYSAKTVDEATEAALAELNLTIDQVEIEVLERESSGFLGFHSKPARINVRVKTVEVNEPAEIAEAMISNSDICNTAVKFLDEVLTAMDIKAEIKVDYNVENEEINVELAGDDMGVLIGKRGATLDSLQYLVSLVVNKESEKYIKVKLDTENYRERRKETLENLAHNIAIKVKKTRRNVSLEPMNPYERRIIHSCLQNDKFVETHSEGEEPYRKVVITLKKGVQFDDNRRRYGRGNNRFNDNNKKKISSSREFHKKYGADTKDYSTDYKKDYAAYLESKAAAKAAAEAEKNN